MEPYFFHVSLRSPFAISIVVLLRRLDCRLNHVPLKLQLLVHVSGGNTLHICPAHSGIGRSHLIGQN
ncbi:hypothetical protein P8452_46263 [Trifolium repens]|nr:hypothetical protein P8452_46263 [Trifolium repens]